MPDDPQGLFQNGSFAELEQTADFTDSAKASESGTTALRQFVLDSGSGTDTLALSLLDTMAFGDVERFMRRHGGKNALNQRRLAERRDAIRDLVRFYPTLASGHQLAAAIECDLADLLQNGQLAELQQTAGLTQNGGFAELRKDAALRRVIDLSRGDPPGFETIRKALAGKDDETI